MSYDEDHEPDIDDTFDSCNSCDGTGMELEGDLVIGDCPTCNGSGVSEFS